MSIISTNKILNLSFDTSSPTSIKFHDCDGVAYGNTYYTMYDNTDTVTLIPANCVKTVVRFDMPNDFLLNKQLFLAQSIYGAGDGVFNALSAPGTPAQVNFLMNLAVKFMSGGAMELSLIDSFFVRQRFGLPREVELIISGHTPGDITGYQITFAIQERTTT
jgi:hypothetical protein